MPTKNAVAALKRSTKGLLYMSESDEPFETVTWKDAKGPLTREKLLVLSGHDPGTKIEEVDLDEFFRDLLEADDDDDEARKSAAKYKALIKTIKDNLDDPKVFRVGEVEVEIYIVGRTQNRDWAGLKTTATET